ncbi:MAG: hypothetical protein LBQ54_09960 [Planctomycetaceae bacterium]|jgi:hypothetical protein|nr:hypothetical protein [Planctomycetaceae bacterium]
MPDIKIHNRLKPVEMSRIALYVFIVSVIAVIVFRACTMSLTTDEAYTVNIYAVRWKNIFSPELYLPNNHVLHTVLVWIMFHAVPWEEWVIRLPAVLGGIGCLILLRKIGAFLFEKSPEKTRFRYVFTLLLTALVALHPLIFQFFSFARGYGLSLFFSLLGCYTLMQYIYVV